MFANMIDVRPYDPSQQAQWDDFVRTSKNGTFLFLRGYMDYHADRFPDHSLMFFDDEALIGLLPATVSPTDSHMLTTHAGLTYGGLVMSERSTTAQVCHIFEAMMTYLRAQGFRQLLYKAVPHIYHRLPAEEDLYALHQVCHAQLVGRNVSATLDLQHRLPIRERRVRYIKAAKRRGMQIIPSTDFSAYWPILNGTLGRKYDAQAVHTLAEIELLHSRFPQNIHLLLSQLDGVTLSGAVLFVTDTCVHAQYLCSSPEGDAVHSNELMVDYIFQQYADLPYFDFGTSADEGPLGINPTLLATKESYGCRAIMYDTYLVAL